MKRSVAHDIVQTLGSLEVLDAPGKAIGRLIRKLLPAGPVKDVLSGTFMGHALHPLLTDVPIGTWTSATTLDLVGGSDSERSSELLIAIGIAAAAPTAVSGWSDWADTEPGSDEIRRIGIIHAVSNVAALGLYAASLAARRRGQRGTGVALGLAGAGAFGAGGWLGGDLAYARGVGVNETAFDSGPEGWTAVLDASMLAENRPTPALLADIELVLVRRNGSIHALDDHCAHRGGSLHEGELLGDCIECPLHGTRIRLDDGSVQRGPSAYPQPVYEAREHNGRVEVRAAG
jgi:nitrite reductase/ring-hydroxylating ferredoxin subunit/uncharacterized membrane protein